MADDQNRRRGIDATLGVQSGEQVRRRMATHKAQQPVSASWNINRLMLQRAVDAVNRNRRDMVPPGAELRLEFSDTTASLSLNRVSDGAVLHKSRALPLSLVGQSNVHGMVRDFLEYKSLEKYENPL